MCEEAVSERKREEKEDSPDCRVRRSSQRPEDRDRESGLGRKVSNNVSLGNKLNLEIILKLTKTVVCY